jgi:uncharacterized SAM-binding protein YcdF (DUF218 family)
MTSLMPMDSAVIDLAQQLWNYLRLDLPVERADCIVGLGSYDLRVADRCAELYTGGWAPLIIFSGHLGNWTRRAWDRSEAEIFADRAVAKGVPREKVRLETRSTNIGENVRFTRDFLLAQGLHIESLIMVSKPSTERRMFATCQQVWPDMKVCFTSPRLSFADQLRDGIQEGLIHEMVGDIQRIRVYPALGFQIPQDIPVGVWNAYERLVSMGFDKHLIGAG